MAKVQWKRNGKWMEKNVLLVFGYQLNEDNQFVKNANATTMINPIGFNHFCCVEDTLEELGGEFPVKFRFGDVAYFCDIPLFNSINELASEIMWDAADTICNNEQEDATGFSLV